MATMPPTACSPARLVAFSNLVAFPNMVPFRNPVFPSMLPSKVSVRETCERLVGGPPVRAQAHANAD